MLISTIRFRASLAAAGLTAAVLLAGCGGASHQSQVASLATSGNGHAHASTGSAPSASGAIPDPDGRPRASLDDTNAQFNALYGPYDSCLRAHNFINAKTASAQLAVASACEKLEPLAAWQVDPANPQARAFIGRTVSCLDGRGYHTTAVLLGSLPDQAAMWTIRYSPSRLNYTPQRPVTAQDACQQQALR